MKNNRPPLTPEEAKKANLLCIISIVCEIIGIFIDTVLYPKLTGFMYTDTTIANVDSANILSSIFGMFSGILMLAGLVLMIIVRIKYPQSKFGLVLMIIYIVVIVLAVIVVLVLAVLCASLCNTCLGGPGTAFGLLGLLG